MNHYHRLVCSIRPLTVGTPLLKKNRGAESSVMESKCIQYLYILTKTSPLTCSARAHNKKFHRKRNGLILYILSLFAKAAIKWHNDICNEKIYPRNLNVVDHIKRIKQIRVNKFICWSMSWGFPGIAQSHIQVAQTHAQTFGKHCIKFSQQNLFLH